VLETNVVERGWDPERLTASARACCGKAANGSRGVPMFLYLHLADAASVAAYLFENFLPANVRRRISRALPGGEGDALLLATWLAGVHDIGKATPPWVYDKLSARAGMEAQGLYVGDQAIASAHKGRHELTGMIILEEWLAERHHWADRDTKQLSVIIGGHHGLPPTLDQYNEARKRPYLLGWSNSDGPLWRQAQFELLDWVAESTGAAERFEAWEHLKLPQPIQVLLTSLVILADWIASNEELFPYRLESSFEDRIQNALNELDLPAPWHPVKTSELERSPDVLESRFGLGTGTELRPVQAAALAAAGKAEEPTLMIIEAPMGEGKTEAALLAAEVFAGLFDAGGCFIALPTQATSDAMFARVLEWLKRLPDSKLGVGAHSVALAHAKAHLNTMYTSIFRRGKAGNITQEEQPGGNEVPAAYISHWWLAGHKKTFLFNNFVIGTIDQLLFMALKAKHLSMRHLSLAGKVVVIDEAHAYDVYMGEYLDRAIEWLAAYGVPVIILSATLPEKRRRELVSAYERGRRGPKRRTRGTPNSEPEHPELQGDIGYPTVVTSRAGLPADFSPIAASGRNTSVEIHKLDDSLGALAAMVKDEINEGGCALVLRNTVGRAQEAADHLREIFGDDVTVTHARFTAPDRALKDDLLLRKFGPPGKNTDRPGKHVVVATQVAEQSLDIDFDVLFTDIAPTDLILQRIGRLHRHRRRERTRTARCYLTGVNWQATVPVPNTRFRYIYDQWSLLRSAAIFLPFIESGTSLRLPSDISPLIRAAYGDAEIGPVGWRDAFEAVAKERDAKQARQREQAGLFRLGSPKAPGEDLLDWVTGRSPIPDEESSEGRAIVRDMPYDSIEVLLIARDGDRYSTLPWLGKFGGVPIPTRGDLDDEFAQSIAATTLSLPGTLTGERVRKEIRARSEGTDWMESPFLHGRLILDIDLNEGTALYGRRLRYDQRDGLRDRPL
jgi:CRISPR-associated endonuclease/helicase Cas3